MISADQLAQRLADEGTPAIAGTFTDDTGLAFLCDASERTVRRWRSDRRGPKSIQLSKIVYDLEEIARWMNDGGQK